MDKFTDSIHFSDNAGQRSAPYQGVVAQSHYIPMRDGVNIAIDICLPKDLPPMTKLRQSYQVRTRMCESVDKRCPAIVSHRKSTTPSNQATILCKNGIQRG